MIAAVGRAALGLVGAEDDGRARAAQQLRQHLVDGRDAHAGVDQEEAGVRLRDRALGEPAHSARQRVVGDLLEARRVDDGEAQVAEARLALAQVARDARPVVHEREPPPDEPVEQRGLADVRPSDDGEREHIREPCMRGSGGMHPPSLHL